MPAPPEKFFRYRLISAPSAESLCAQVSEALDMGFELYGSPAVTHNGKNIVPVQAVIWPEGTTPPEAPKKEGMKISSDAVAASRRGATRFP